MPLKLLVVSLMAAILGSSPRTEKTHPIVIAHRGASGLRPEHTLAAYELAIKQGADFIEPDLVVTKDGVLVARHENEISETTDVSQRPEFADRRTTKKIAGREATGWFTEDFSLSELKTLRAAERLPKLRPESAQFNGRFEIPTFDEVLHFAKTQSAVVGRTIGVYPETKHPAYFQSLGLPLEPRVVDVLNAHGYRQPDSPVFLQSFEPASLREMQRLTAVRRIQLLGDRPPAELESIETPAEGTNWLTPKILARIKTYADGIGPDKSLIIPRDQQGNLREPTTLVRDAHAAGLLVHPYTFRNENAFLPTGLRLGDPSAPDFAGRPGDFAAEYRLFFRLGVDGLFSDFPAAAVAARRE